MEPSEQEFHEALTNAEVFYGLVLSLIPTDLHP